MDASLFTDIAIFILSLLVGFEVISKIPSTLHTPMMSGANAIHGVVVVGAILIAAEAHTYTGYILTFLAAFFAAINVIGGYTVTDRMLSMFKKPKPPAAPEKNDAAADKGASK